MVTRLISIVYITTVIILYLCTLKQLSKQGPLNYNVFTFNHGQKSWDTFALLGVLQCIQAQPLPSPHRQCWTRVSRILSEFQLCKGWGEGELQENFEKDTLFYEGTQNERKL